MNNFEFKNPTKIIFGKNQISKLNTQIPEKATILMLFGGGSIMKNGIYNQVKDSLKDYNIIEFGGITANPEYNYLIKALEIIKNKSIDYLLAVGGGSVIDGTKFIAAAAKYNGDSPWDILKNRIKINDALPFATVLTLPATASEMNSGAVISRKDTNEKLGMGGPALFPQFSILDPTVIESIPKRQIANGLTDSFMHVLEQYLTYPTGALLQDRFSESILKTIIEVAPKLMKDNSDYKAAANFMWSCTMALNGLIYLGVPTDWVTHAIGHELTALYNIDHARTLAIIAPNLYKHAFETKKDKLVQLGERVFDINTGTKDEKATKCIDGIQNFFHSLEIKTSISDYTDNYKDAANIISNRFTERDWLTLGEHKNIKPKDVAQIVEMAY